VQYTNQILLADRTTNGRAYATTLRLSVVCNACIAENLSEEANGKWPMGNRMVA